MTPLVHGLLDRMRALTRNLLRPFAPDHDGFFAGEGATLLVLESEDSVHARGARILARVAGGARAFDPTATPVGFGRDPERLAQSLRAGIAQSKIDAGRIGKIVSGASGARMGDRSEALTLRAAFAPRPLPPLVAPKAVTGEYGGGLLASALLAVSEARFERPVGFDRAAPELGVSPHQGVLPGDSILVTALASGGAVAWAVLERP